MTSQISKCINGLECTMLHESQVILTQESAAAEVARFWFPECAARPDRRAATVPGRAVQQQDRSGQVKARFQVGPIDPTILYVGDLSDRYGPDLLVKAMPAILRNHPQARLIARRRWSAVLDAARISRYLLLGSRHPLPRQRRRPSDARID